MALRTPLHLITIALADTTQPAYEKWKDSSFSGAEDELVQVNQLISELGLSQGAHNGLLERIEEVRNKGLMAGREFTDVLAALAYIVAREHEEPRTLSEISQVTGLSEKRIGRTYRHIGRDLDIRLIAPQPEAFLSRFATKLAYSNDVKDRAEEIIVDARDAELLSGRSPTGIAAAALFLAAEEHNEPRTQREIADVLNLATITVRERVEELREVGGDPEKADTAQQSA